MPRRQEPGEDVIAAALLGGLGAAVGDLLVDEAVELGPGLHPDASGYDKVTDAFLEVLGSEA